MTPVTRSPQKTAFFTTANIVNSPRERKPSKRLLEAATIAGNWTRKLIPCNEQPRRRVNSPTAKAPASSKHIKLSLSLDAAHELKVARRNPTDMLGLRHPPPRDQKSSININSGIIESDGEDREQMDEDSEEQDDDMVEQLDSGQNNEGGLQCVRNFLSSTSDTNIGRSTSTPSHSYHRPLARAALSFSVPNNRAELEKRQAQEKTSEEEARTPKRRKATAAASENTGTGPSDQSLHLDYSPIELRSIRRPSSETINADNTMSECTAVENGSSRAAQVIVTEPSSRLSTGMLEKIQSNDSTMTTCPYVSPPVSESLGSPPNKNRAGTQPSPHAHSQSASAAEASPHTPNAAEELQQNYAAEKRFLEITEAYELYKKLLSRTKQIDDAQEKDVKKKKELQEAITTAQKTIEGIDGATATLMGLMNPGQLQAILEQTEQKKTEKMEERQDLEAQSSKLNGEVVLRLQERKKIRNDCRIFEKQAKGYEEEVDTYIERLEDRIKAARAFRALHMGLSP